VATLDQLKLKVYVDEVDLSALQTGQQVLVTFNAHPNQTFSGRVQAIEPTLQNVGGTLTAVAWVELENEPGILLLSGMTAEVEIIAGEARGALLVPVQALRELAPDSFSVFIVQEDGQLKLTPVKVGLRDFANAQILSGLEAGDIVSTGAVETK
jgi:RND family efflux transporter MFP subunit